MATTTNYSWSTPDDTALVKDGAAAIRSLGTAIDSTVFTNAGAAINKTIIDAAGDLIYGTAADTAARLAIGTANQQLRVNSGATAPEWFTPTTAGGITLINTGGTSLSGSSVTISSIPTTYSSLQIVYKNVSVTTACGLFMRFNGDTGNNYYDSSTATDKLGPFGSISTTNTVAENNYGVLNVPQYTQTSGQQVAFLQGYDNFNNQNANKTMWYTKSAAITSVTILPEVDTFTNGTIWVYGVS
jgi:hypothetical protein